MDRGKRSFKRSAAVDANGILLSVAAALANRHRSPLLGETQDAVVETLGGLPDRASIHLDRGYDSKATRELLENRGLIGVIWEKSKPAPLRAGTRGIVERANSWHDAHKMLVWCTERQGRIIDFWIAFPNVAIVIYRREAAHSGSLDPLPLGNPTFLPTMINHLLAQPLRVQKDAPPCPRRPGG